ncbi:hypothetical protein M9H77_06412 [Catharanthus roseus]|uniref:Uncharacterized protein n=1 Tax=Catharanthus roseus TaxID=4058 RepID=A0ACC0BSA9_CATRO|nr:hypothetical protein M9H77_06412 [Catharanthus roseus]
MEFGFICTLFMVLFGGYLALKWLFGGHNRSSLPPGDLGLPFIGNMLSFLTVFKSKNPDSFISKFAIMFFLLFSLTPSLLADSQIEYNDVVNKGSVTMAQAKKICDNVQVSLNQNEASDPWGSPFEGPR